MFKKLFIFVGLLAILAACSAQKTVEDPISEGEVVEVLTEQGFILEKSKKYPTNNVFTQVLKGVTPDVYLLDGNLISIYVFSTSKERAEAVVEFEEKTATMELIDHQIYGLNNVLVFYVSAEERLQKDLFEALMLLDTPE
ncbi:hypothetical protein HF078_10995 [Bacillus sp. RO2]|uniref:hypothetical protein n=1 Tax=Bacillus sp. RO2 TaxID=2723913 RepID=UPI00145EEE28|nr:hypothetical protein [Bacillus sp. RO2]NMH73604.1 hypothetical protein [Bacillus sp. RO2]